MSPNLPVKPKGHSQATTRKENSWKCRSILSFLPYFQLLCLLESIPAVTGRKGKALGKPPEHYEAAVRVGKGPRCVHWHMGMCHGPNRSPDRYDEWFGSCLDALSAWGDGFTCGRAISLRVLCRSEFLFLYVWSSKSQIPTLSADVWTAAMYGHLRTCQQQ